MTVCVCVSSEEIEASLEKLSLSEPPKASEQQPTQDSSAAVQPDRKWVPVHPTRQLGSPTPGSLSNIVVQEFNVLPKFQWFHFSFVGFYIYLLIDWSSGLFHTHKTLLLSLILKKKKILSFILSLKLFKIRLCKSEFKGRKNIKLQQ